MDGSTALQLVDQLRLMKPPCSIGLLCQWRLDFVAITVHRKFLVGEKFGE